MSVPRTTYIHTRTERQESDRAAQNRFYAMQHTRYRTILFLGLSTDFASLTFANESIYRKSVRSIHAPTNDEYFGQKIFDIGSNI